MAGDGAVAGRQLSFSAELRRLTGDQHERVETLLDLPWRLTSPGDLVALLQAWSVVWSDVRSGCGSAGRDESARLLVSAVRAVQQLAADLADLAVVEETRVTTPLGIPRKGQAVSEPLLAPLLGSPAGVWAVSYVLRGFRVGGTVLAPLIAQRLRLPAGVAADYFSDAAAGSSWVAFRRRLDSWSRSAGTSARQDAVRLARDVFDVVGARLATALPPAQQQGPRPERSREKGHEGA